MSKMQCKCGHIIRDQTDSLSYKASILKDELHERFFDWAAVELETYLQAALLGNVHDWLEERGYNDGYIALMLSHGNVLHDHLHSRYASLSRDMYECQQCGRLHVECIENDHFFSYAPDAELVHGVLSPRGNS